MCVWYRFAECFPGQVISSLVCARKYVPAGVCVRLCAADKRLLATLHSTHHVLLLKEHVHVSSTSK